MSMFKTKYRIVTDSFAGYEVQYKPWWWPWFIQCGRTGGINTHTTLIEAINYLFEFKDKDSKKGKVVYEYY